MLYTLALVLPTAESLKSASAVLYLVFWLLHHTAKPASSERQGLDAFEWILLAIFAWTIFGTFNSLYFDAAQLKTETKGLRDTMLWLIPMWLVYRSNYPLEIINRVANILLAGIVFGLLWGDGICIHHIKQIWNFIQLALLPNPQLTWPLG